jgi:hypothetical protein
MICLSISEQELEVTLLSSRLHRDETLRYKRALDTANPIPKCLSNGWDCRFAKREISGNDSYINAAHQYAGFFPYVDWFWLGESFQYNSVFS